MSRADAERWAASSKVTQDTYHITTSVANARSIMENGFDLGRREFGRMWGDGVYVGADNETAKLYTRFVGRGARKLTIKMDVRNPFAFKAKGDSTTGSGFTKVDIVMDALKLPYPKAMKELQKVGGDLSRVLSVAGYDALHIIPTAINEGVGGNQIVVFDPKKVVVINE